MDIGGRSFTGAIHDQRMWEPVDMMRHPTYAKSDPTDKKGFLKFIIEFQVGNYAMDLE